MHREIKENLAITNMSGLNALPCHRLAGTSEGPATPIRTTRHSRNEPLWNVRLNADETSPRECVVVRSLRSFASELWAALGDKGGDSLLRVAGAAGFYDRFLLCVELI